MQYLIHKKYIDPATNRLVLTADPLQLTSSVSTAIKRRNGSSFSMFPQANVTSGSLNDISPTMLAYDSQPALLEHLSSVNYKESLYDDVPEITDVHTYISPKIAPFNGVPSLLVIDITKVPELNVENYHAVQSTLDETKSPLSVAIDEFTTGDDDRVVVNQENIAPQVIQTPPTVFQGSKRKARYLQVEEEEELSNDSKPSSGTKRRKCALKVRNENKKEAAKATKSGGDEKPFKCPYCTYTSKRSYNLKTHIETHDPNRVKKFACSQCNKVFTRKHDRDRHELKCTR